MIESIIFKELDLFYNFIMGFNLFNHIFEKHDFLYNTFYGFAKKDWWGVYSPFPPLIIYTNISMFEITVYVNDI